MSALERQFYIQQNRKRPRHGRRLWGPARQTAPIFSRPATGSSPRYDIPAYMRKRISQSDAYNRYNLEAYVGRVKAHIQEQAA